MTDESKGDTVSEAAHGRRLLARRALTVIATIVVLGLLVVAGTGTVLFRHAAQDDLRHADAVFVLGGEHDGREDYGLQLVRDGVAPVLVLSNPYRASDPVIRRACETRVRGVEVLCVKPKPSTTLGEALLIRQLARERGWKTIVVASWQYHLPRARFIFRRCFSSSPDSTIMRAVPRDYHLTAGSWEYTYLYQFFALGKAVMESGESGKCE